MKINKSTMQADIEVALQEIALKYKCKVEVIKPKPAIMGSDICVLETSIFLTWEEDNG